MAQSLPKYYKAAIVEGPGLPLKLVELEQKQPGPGQVLVKVLLAAYVILMRDCKVASSALTTSPVFPVTR